MTFLDEPEIVQVKVGRHFISKNYHTDNKWHIDLYMGTERTKEQDKRVAEYIVPLLHNRPNSQTAAECYNAAFTFEHLDEAVNLARKFD